MRVNLRYFASLREATGRESEPLDLPEGSVVESARESLVARYPNVAAVLPRCATAINRAYVAGDAPLHEGDELVFIPPLGGG